MDWGSLLFQGYYMGLPLQGLREVLVVVQREVLVEVLVKVLGEGSPSEQALCSCHAMPCQAAIRSSVVKRLLVTKRFFVNCLYQLMNL